MIDIKKLVKQLELSAYLGKKFLLKNINKETKQKKLETDFFEKEKKDINTNKLVSVEYEIWMKLRKNDKKS
jgi:hypothetical protein